MSDASWTINSWVLFTFLAAFMQAVRTAGQKELSFKLSPMSVTLVRYLFGLPFAIAYLYFLLRSDTPTALLSAIGNQKFLVYVVLAGIAQIVATVLLVKVFSFRNFAVGTSFAKTEAIQTAVFGLVFFSSALSMLGWLAVFIGFVGILIVSVPKRNMPWEPANVIYGTLSGTAFSFTSLWLREASLSLGMEPMNSAAITLVCIVTFQTLICLLYSIAKEPGQLALIKQSTGLSLFVGFTSAVGSIGWFTAFSLQNPALVKSLGQIEFIFTLIITFKVFKEKVSAREMLGMFFIVVSVILILR